MNWNACSFLLENCQKSSKEIKPLFCIFNNNSSRCRNLAAMGRVEPVFSILRPGNSMENADMHRSWRQQKLPWWSCRGCILQDRWLHRCVLYSYVWSCQIHKSHHFNTIFNIPCLWSRIEESFKTLQYNGNSHPKKVLAHKHCKNCKCCYFMSGHNNMY